jgi:two-component system, chemotaxis family, CheB/CheR fusion protein
MTQDLTKQNNSFPIVGIGASAGGLEALEGLFAHMPPDSNIAFVIIQHLSPKYKSVMDSLLQKHTTMTVREVMEGMVIEPNCVYLNPPDHNVVIMSQTFHLVTPIKTHGINLPIDCFFRALAEEQAEKAICIILSGTGADGTLGLKAIKGAGGMTMVQAEPSYDGMPRSAINTGQVDFVLPVDKIPDALLKYVRHPYIKQPTEIETPEEQFQQHLQKIFFLIRSGTGHDFSNYKQNTIRRRIERRLAVHRIDKIEDYVHYLQQTPTEVEALFKDLLIGVTSFFRDPEAFEILQKDTLLDLVKNKGPNSPIRIWVVGCATGEEAFSIAMLISETLDELKKHSEVQIFASDLDHEAIDYARMAIYQESIAADVSLERLTRFFIKEDNTYKLKKQIREMVVFTQQNLINDPPFSRLDMVSCRNLLIYMDQPLQKKLLPLFHYTLNQNGILFLGSSESIGELTDYFSVIDSKWKIFKRNEVMLDKLINYPNIPFFDGYSAKHHLQEKTVGNGINLRSLVEKIVLDDYTLPCVLVNDKHEVLYFVGHTDNYLKTPTGEPSFNVLKMAREGLQHKLSAALHRVTKQQKTITYEGVQVRKNGDIQTINLLVRPLTGNHLPHGLTMVIFENQTPTQKGVRHKTADIEPDPQISSLEQELQSTREYLQTTIEELETSNEELKSTNEELQSVNEELQSSNEELKTSKEELQSTNEELTTVNAELQSKVDELSQANNDINNLLASTEIGTIFLDNALHIKRFTPAIKKLFNLIPSDIDRPISDITSNILYEDIYTDTKTVLDTLVRKEIEVQSQTGNWYSMRIVPYRTTDNIIDGVVITFVDITKVKTAENLIRQLATIVNESTDAIMIPDLSGLITSWNKGAEHMYGYSEKEALKMNIAQFVSDDKKQEAVELIEQSKTAKVIKCIETKIAPFVTEDNKPETLELIEQFKDGNIIEAVETKRITKNGEILDVCLTLTKLEDKSSNIIAVAITERDITKYKRAEQKYEKTIADLKKQLAELTAKS